MGISLMCGRSAIGILENWPRIQKASSSSSTHSFSLLLISLSVIVEIWANGTQFHNNVLYYFDILDDTYIQLSHFKSLIMEFMKGVFFGKNGGSNGTGPGGGDPHARYVTVRHKTYGSMKVPVLTSYKGTRKSSLDKPVPRNAQYKLIEIKSEDGTRHFGAYDVSAKRATRKPAAKKRTTRRKK